MMDIVLHAAAEPGLSIWGFLLIVFAGVFLGRALYMRKRAFECGECDYWMSVDEEGGYHCPECGTVEDTHEYRSIDLLRDDVADLVGSGGDDVDS